MQEWLGTDWFCKCISLDDDILSPIYTGRTAAPDSALPVPGRYIGLQYCDVKLVVENGVPVAKLVWSVISARHV